MLPSHFNFSSFSWSFPLKNSPLQRAALLSCCNSRSLNTCAPFPSVRSDPLFNSCRVQWFKLDTAGSTAEFYAGFSFLCQEGISFLKRKCDGHFGHEKLHRSFIFWGGGIFQLNVLQITCFYGTVCCVFQPANGCSAHCLLIKIIRICVKTSFFIFFRH